MNPPAPITPEALAMLGCVTVLFFGMKALVIARWCRTGPNRFRGPRQALLFVVPCPGMGPAGFLRPARPVRAWWGRGVLAVISGCTTLALGHLLAARGWPRAAVAPVVLAGFSLFLHFGVFTLLAAAYREAHFGVALPFASPHRAGSLREFWGGRWNRPFMELTAQLVSRPIARALPDPAGARRAGAASVAFLFSGLVHEAAITLPVGTGYGGPSLYFLLQGLGWMIEQGGAIPKAVRRFWLWVCVLVPLPLLFPPDFVFRVLFPLAGIPQ